MGGWEVVQADKALGRHHDNLFVPPKVRFVECQQMSNPVCTEYGDQACIVNLHTAHPISNHQASPFTGTPQRSRAAT